MNVISIPPIAMATLMFYVGFYHFLIYCRQRDNRENLTFTISCFSVGLYAICCAGLYNAPSPEVGVEWQRLQLTTLALLAVSLLWFIADYTKRVNKKILLGFTVYYIFSALVELLSRSELIWTNVASIKEIRLPFGYDVRYNEMAPGVLSNFNSIVGLFYFFYIFSVSLKFYRSGNKEKGMHLLIAMGMLCAGLINDILMSSGFYNFIYILEYSYIGIILMFTFFLTINVIKAGEIKIALLKSEKQTKKLIEQSPVAMAVSSPDNKIISFNKKFVKLFGYDVTDTQSVDDWFLKAYPDKAIRNAVNEQWDNEILKYFETGKFRIIVAKVCCKDGSYKDIEFDFEAVDNQYIISLIDITDQIKARQDVQREKDFSENLINSMPGIFFLYQYENDEFLLKKWNRNHEVILKFSGLQLKDNPMETFFRKSDIPLLDTVVSQILKKGSVKTELEIQAKDGVIIPFFIQAVKFKEGKNTFIIGNGMDITEQKQFEKERDKLQRQLIQTQKMETMGTLAGGIAHDFNNILFPILGHTEMLLADIPKESPLQRSINQIYSAATRAKDLVQQILTFSRQEDTELRLIKIHYIIKEAIKLIRSTIPATIEIRQDIDRNCAPVKADPTQIHQIIMNLATNAYHAMEDTNGELKIILKEVELGDADLINPNMEKGPYVCLTVSDSGIGMTHDILDKVFDPFYTTKGKGKGTGLGLSVVHGIVTSTGGAIQVNSEPGKGTEFKVYFPAGEIISKDRHIKIEEPIQGGTEKILLVDDEEAIIEIEEQLLERLDYQVTSYTSSVEALEAFRATPKKFDLVISDVAMPKLSGDRLATKLIEINPDIPILLCTGFSTTISEEKIAALGIKGLLLKPIVMRNLSRKIREVLDNCYCGGETLCPKNSKNKLKI
jgi:PAS domain S-box-containing protein